MRTIKNKLTLTKSKVIRLYNLIKNDIDFQSEIVNSKELKELQIITEIKYKPIKRTLLKMYAISLV